MSAIALRENNGGQNGRRLFRARGFSLAAMNRQACRPGGKIVTSLCFNFRAHSSFQMGTDLYTMMANGGEKNKCYQTGHTLVPSLSDSITEIA